MITLDNTLFNIIQETAETNPRRRMNMDLRTQAFEEGWKDQSQKMLNVLMADSVIPIHRHTETNEVVCVLRGSGYEVTYNDDGSEKERVLVKAGSECAGAVLPRGEWHTFIALEDGTTILESKDRAYDPVHTEVILKR